MAIELTCDYEKVKWGKETMQQSSYTAKRDQRKKRSPFPSCDKIVKSRDRPIVFDGET